MSEFDQPRVVLLTWEGIDAVIADEWDSMPPALRSACHSLREYTRELPRLIDEKNAAVDALATLQRSADEMREALEPFASARDNSGSALTTADFDRARAAFIKATQENADV
jgi:hypothetical protein